jgi:monoterpene epsilon-lactone hydrolase
MARGDLQMIEYAVKVVTVLLVATVCAAAGHAAQEATVADDGTVQMPGVPIPYSDLASAQAKANFVEYVRAWQRFNAERAPGEPIEKTRERLDREMMIPGLARLRQVFAVDIVRERIGGVQTDVVVPASGISSANRHRVLINLHGGGMAVAARYGGQMESVPVASLGRIKVVTVDYRMAPEWRFPAASEDVANVYRELLKTYRPENIGIYGCSAGAALTAQSLAWFQAHRLPRPGAVGMFGYGADTDHFWGDSNYVASPLMGWRMPHTPPGAPLPGTDYLAHADFDDPLVNPASSSKVLSAFPPALLLSGTRDMALSKLLSTHARLVQLGVPAELHVWDGAWHCSFAQTVVDPEVPEHRQAWEAIVRFFSRHLGKR